MHTDWPTWISHAIRHHVGPAPESTNLSGMSGASVVRLRGTRGTAILKRSVTSREWHVYTRLGDEIRGGGIGMPELLAESAGDGAWWLLLEDIPHPLPEGRMLADPELIGMLLNLASLPRPLLEMPADRYVPTWPQEMTEQALSLFDDAVADRMRVPLASIRERCLPLLDPYTVVSGDPNPGNWGVRDDGSLVLFDWERCTLATPPVDLGISVPGLGDMDAFRAVSRAYGGDDRNVPGIAHAKVWSVVEFLAGCASGKTVPAFELDALLGRIPAWVVEAAEV